MINRTKTDKEIVQEAARALAFAATELMSDSEYEQACVDMVEAVSEEGGVMAIQVSDRWFVGCNGHRFFDWGGFRYCAYIQMDGRYSCHHNGQPMEGARFDSLKAAQTHIEKVSGYRSQKREAV